MSPTDAREIIKWLRDHGFSVVSVLGDGRPGSPYRFLVEVKDG